MSLGYAKTACFYDVRKNVGRHSIAAIMQNG
jgi:hypothetical protein